MPDFAELLLNGHRPGKQELRRFTDAIADPDRLTAGGGYLFKSFLTGRQFYLSICPAISEGERLHHYDLSVPDPRHIIGSISANGDFTLLYKAHPESFDEGERRYWRSQFTAFAAGLLAAGYRGAGTLDWITRQIIRETGLFNPVPGTLGEIAVMAPDGRIP